MPGHEPVAERPSLNSAFRRLDPDEPPPEDQQRSLSRAVRTFGAVPESRPQSAAPNESPSPRLADGGSIVPASGAGPVAEDVDWAAVPKWRDEVRRLLVEALGTEDLTGDAEEQGRARGIIHDVVMGERHRRLAAGEPDLSDSQFARTMRAVHDALFGLGRLQPLLDVDDVENVEIIGFDNVTLRFSDGSTRRCDPVAQSDRELVGMLAFIATWNGRAFDPSNPMLDMSLPGGLRLSAHMGVSHRPSVVIRRDNIKRVALDDLVTRGSMSRGLADFLAAAVRAHKSIVVSGMQGEGKTTLLRALAGAIPADERIATIETEYELGLHDMPDRHQRVVAYEARRGSGEPLPNGRRAGEITEGDLLYSTFRGNFRRVFVGEVRGVEILPMIEAMQTGTGSMSTVHSKNASGVLHRLVTAAIKAGQPADFAYRALGSSVDLIVQVRLQDDRWKGGGRQRFVTEVLLVQPDGENGMPAMSTIYRPGADGRAQFHHAPHDLLDDLRPFGLDVTQYRTPEVPA